MTTITPLGNYIVGVVKTLGEENSPILRPEGTQGRVPYLLVIDVGPLCSTLKKGDRVLCFEQGLSVPLDQPYVLCPESSVFGKLEGSDDPPVEAPTALAELTQ